MTTGGANGQVITFYSYKGGTGRSMALANMAWVLAMAGKRVLAIDWDLEAPGLHRYFHPFLSDPELTSTEGVIDFVIRFVEEASARPPETRHDDWFVPYTRIAHYACPIDYPFANNGELDFIPAGKQGEPYAARVNSLNWKQFYERLGGWSVIERMGEQLRALYDIVLIDSRTGVSDTAGICTVQLPDTVVVCFTLNFQSIDGASAVARSILTQRARLRKPVRLLPVPTRVELHAEKVKYEEVSAYAMRRFLSTPEQQQPLEGTDSRTYWDDVAVPYIGFYVFEEQLAWFLDQNRTTGDLAATLRLAKHAAGVEATSLTPPTDREREDVIAQYAAVWKERLRADREIDFSQVCLVLIPFGSKDIVGGTGEVRTVDFEALYAELFDPAIRKVRLPDGRSLIAMRVDREFFGGDITTATFEALEQARLVLADVSGLNPNVMYELGVRHRARESGTVIFRQIDAKLPFDIAAIKAFSYEYRGDAHLQESRELIVKVLEELLARTHHEDTAMRLTWPGSAERPNVESSLRAAENAIRVGDRTKAIAEYRSVLRLDPGNALVQLRAGLLFSDEGSWREALEHFDQAVALAPDYADAWREKGMAENRLFGRALGRGDQANGIASLQRAIALNPNDFAAHASLGAVFKRAGQLEEALAAYERATQLSQGYPTPLLNVIALRAMVTGKIVIDSRQRLQVVRARKTLLAQVGSEPPFDAPWSFFELAELTLFLGDAEAALAYAQRGVEYAQSGWELNAFRQTLRQIADSGVTVPGLPEIVGMLDAQAGYFEAR